MWKGYRIKYRFLGFFSTIIVEIFKTLYKTILDIETDIFILYKINPFELFSNMTLSDFNIYTEILINKIKELENKGTKNIPLSI
jgi:hypothetical protein